MKRRVFIKHTALGGTAIATGATVHSCLDATPEQQTAVAAPVKKTVTVTPIAICTWGFAEASAEAGRLLASGAPALDAAIAGVGIEEANVKNTTVGIGATPDRDGHVTLDACVMNAKGDCGAVVAVEHIVHVAALARKVMEASPHVMLAGAGATAFAYEQGFQKQELLTEEQEKKWKEWLKTSTYQPEINIENHDTIGMLTLDQQGDIAGACTTSGLAYKMHGRVGDSPIIGAGLFVDNEIGGAVATGLGEEVLKTVGSFLIVELMRGGMSPQEACEAAIARIVKNKSQAPGFQIAYIAMNKRGETGAYAIHQGFSMMRYQDVSNERIEVDHIFDRD